MKRALLFTLLLTLSLSTLACSATYRWGDKLVYSPDFHGYAYEARKHDDPLVDSVSGQKLRCADEVRARMSHDVNARARFVHDDQTAFVVSWPVAIGTIPLGGPGVMLLFGAGMLEAPPVLVEWAASSASGDALFEQGKRAFDEKRADEATALFERALLKDALRENRRCRRCDSIKSLYWLGRIHEDAGRTAEARRAYEELLLRATIADRVDYDDAEARLAKLAPEALPKCSQEPVSIEWPKGL